MPSDVYLFSNLLCPWGIYSRYDSSTLLFRKISTSDVGFSFNMETCKYLKIPILPLTSRSKVKLHIARKKSNTIKQFLPFSQLQKCVTNRIYRPNWLIKIGVWKYYGDQFFKIFCKFSKVMRIYEIMRSLNIQSKHSTP